MVGWGLWGLGAVAWLWAGGQGAEPRVRHEERSSLSRLQVREAAFAVKPLATEQVVRFVSAPEPRPRDSRPQGDPSWRKGRPASPTQLQVVPSSQAARVGEPILVEVSASEASVVRAEVFRLGVYGGTGAARVWSSEPFTVSSQARCSRAGCPARQSFSFTITRDWEPGLYLVKVTREDGLRSFTSLVVQEPPADEPRS